MARRLTGACGALLLMLAWAGVANAAAGPHAVVLMYHHVGTAGQPSTRVTEEQFRAHLDYLAANDYRVVPLGQVVAALQGDDTLPERAVAITFDDGYRSVGEVAHPLLAERDWPYTVFVNTEPVDAGYANYLDWAQMRRMARQGARFANHSSTHAPLFERRDGEAHADWAARVRADLNGAQARLTEALGAAVHTRPPLLAYPYGEYNDAVMALVDDLGYVAFGQQSGAIGPTSNPLALPRFALNERYGQPEPFALRLDTRALPVIEQSPTSPVRHSPQAPRLVLTLQGDGLATHALGCFYGGERLTPEWLADTRRFAVQGTADLPVGRSRYNCTMPDGEGGFFWFSQLWVYGEGGT